MCWRRACSFHARCWVCFWYVSIREWVFAGRRKSLSETCLPPLYQASEKKNGWQWLWRVISSRGKPRSQWVWPTAAHLEPMRRGEDLLRERESERRKKQRRSWVRRGFLVVPSAIDLLTSPQLQLGGHSPRVSAQRDSAGHWFQVTSLPPPPPICLTTESPPWNMWDIQPGDHYSTLDFNPTRMISCVRSTL